MFLRKIIKIALLAGLLGAGAVPAQSLDVAIGTIPAGKQVTVAYEVTVNEHFAGIVTRVSNQGTVSGDNFTAVLTDDPDTPESGDATESEIFSSDLALDLDVIDPQPAIGDNVDFRLAVTNQGPNDNAGVQVLAQLPAGLAFQSQHGNGSYDSRTGVWNAGNLAVGDSTSLTLTARYEGPGAVIFTAQLTGSTPADPQADNDGDCVRVTGAGADLTIINTVDKPTPQPGDEVVFEILVANQGPLETAGIEVLDILPAGLTFIGDNSAGAYDPASGLWSVGDLASGAAATLTIRAGVNQAGEILNIAGITASQAFDPVSVNNSSALLLNGDPQADLALDKQVDDPTPTAGETIAFTLRAANNGPDNASGVQVRDLLPGGLTYLWSRAALGVYDEVTGIWEIDNLNGGQITTLEIRATVDSLDQIINQAELVSLDQTDPDPTNNLRSTMINLLQPALCSPAPEAAAEIGLSKRVNFAQLDVGSQAVFTLAVRNNGPSAARDLRVDDLLPAGTKFVAATTSQGTYNEDDGQWDVGLLAAGAYALLDLTVEVNQSGAIVNRAVVSRTDKFDPISSNDTAAATVFGLQADIVVLKSVDNPAPIIGGQVVFTIAVTNQGPDAATDVLISDLLPSGLTFIADQPSHGSYDADTGLWNVGSLADQATATLELTTRVGRSGTIGNSATRTASRPVDLDAGNDSGTVLLSVPFDNDGDGLPDTWEFGNGLDPTKNDKNEDPDGDGLTNFDEFQNDTNPQSDDTDQDGMRDGFEITFGLDVHNDDASADPDGDFFSNFEEQLYGTDPIDAASKPQVPFADAGPDQTVAETVTMRLNGFNSTAADGSPVEYLWEQQPNGTAVDFTDPAAIEPAFVSPQVGSGGEALVFELTVVDADGNDATDATIVNVSNDNQPPLADAGSDQTVNEGWVVTLDGRRSTDPDGTIAAFRWIQNAGTPVDLSNATSQNAGFESRPAGITGEALIFELTVTDDEGLMATDTVIVNVTEANQPPTADAGDDKTYAEGATVTLDASGSADSDGTVSSYRWKQIDGPPVTLSDPDIAQPTFVTPAVGAAGAILVFEVVVTDNQGLLAGAATTVTIDDNGITGFPNGALPFISATGQEMAIQILGEGSLVRFERIDPSSIPESPDQPTDMLHGLVEFELKTRPGATVALTVFLRTPAQIGKKWFHYSPAKGWTDFSARAVFNAARDQVLITLTDGGDGDDDEMVNGTIVDPSGPGIPTGSSQQQDDSYLDGDVGSKDFCFINSAAGVLPFKTIGRPFLSELYNRVIQSPDETGMAGFFVIGALLVSGVVFSSLVYTKRKRNCNITAIQRSEHDH